MSLFKKATNDQAYLKMGIMGFTGTGKTYTASILVMGLNRLLKEGGLPGGDAPVFFADTETGSDWIRSDFDKAGIELMVSRTRAYSDLVPMVNEVEKVNGILLIDSVTHFWVELCETYKKQRKRNRLEFQDWDYVKSQWRRFTDRLVNSACHIVICGRAGFEYDFFENDNGRKELEKTGIKMKAEGETGYEPSILVLMQRHQEFNEDKSIKVWRTAEILKDRSRELDGKVFTNPTFEDFLPHIRHLNLGGNQMSVDTSRTSEDLIQPEGPSDWSREQKAKGIVLDEIKELLVKHFPSQSAADKQSKGEMLEKFCGSRSWDRVQTFDLHTLESARNNLWLELEGQSYGLGEIPPSPQVQEALENF